MKFSLIRIALFSVLIVSTIGCTSMKNNRAVIGKHNMTASTALHNGNPRVIGNISIGTIESPYDGAFLFSIRLSNGTIMHSKQFTFEKIQEIATRKIEPIQTGIWKGDKHVLYGVDGYAFIFNDSKLVHFNAQIIQLPDRTLEAEIGGSDMSAFHKLPMPYNEFVRIFGTPAIKDSYFAW